MAEPLPDQEDMSPKPDIGLHREEKRDDRSRSPRREEHRRSRSPRRRDDDGKPRRKDAGFKWKEKRRDDTNSRNGEQDQGLRRGYRDHYKPRSRSPTHQDRSVEKNDSLRKPEKKDKKEKKEKKAVLSGPPEPMIRVKVNDRLGTTTVVPCLASDNVGLFKAMVAARIGRETHEILLKRQGERPFKDILTLADYGVSDGVQLDL